MINYAFQTDVIPILINIANRDMLITLTIKELPLIHFSSGEFSFYIYI